MLVTVHTVGKLMMNARGWEKNSFGKQEFVRKP
jgi:hypothetical protein